jgi:3-oxoacyl-[acyl-carrier-protein] synthase II
MPAERIVVTGTGMVTAAGIGVDACWKTLIAGRSCITHVSHWDPRGMASHIAGEVPGDPPVPPRIGPFEIVGRPNSYGVFAAKEALAQAGLDRTVDVPPVRRAVLVAGGFDDQMITMLARAADRLLAPGTHAFDAVEPDPLLHALTQPGVLLEMRRYSQVQLMQALALHVQARQALTVSTACAGGSTAIGDAMGMLRRGECDVALALGLDTLITREMMGGFCNLTALSTRNDAPERASRPFDNERDGFVMGEGAGALVLEREEVAWARGARPLAVMAGFGYSADAFALTAPEPEGVGMALAMERAIADAGLLPADIDYVNAHGTSTDANDKAETKALRRVFGDHAAKLAVSGTKSMIGHLIHGSGSVGAVVAVKTLQEQVVHPTANYETPDPDCDLDYVAGEARKMKVDGVLVNAFGFGGQNASLVLGRVEARA